MVEYDIDGDIYMIDDDGINDEDDGTSSNIVIDEKAFMYNMFGNFVMERCLNSAEKELDGSTYLTIQTIDYPCSDGELAKDEATFNRLIFSDYYTSDMLLENNDAESYFVDVSMM